MKKYVKMLGLVSTLFMTISCSCKSMKPPFKVVDKDVTLYYLDTRKDSDKLEDYSSSSHHFLAEQDEEYVLYTTLENYASLYKDIYGDVTYEVEKEAWYIRNKDNQLLFIFAIDPYLESLAIGGSLSNALINEQNLNDSSLMLGFDSSTTIYEEGSNLSYFSFKDLGFTSFRHDKKVYYPLSLLNAAVEECGYYIYFDYQNLYICSDPTTYSSVEFDGSTVYAKAKNNLGYKEGDELPSNIISDRKSVLYYLFVNKYGLFSTRGVKNKKDYLDSFDYLEDLDNKNIRKNNEALYKFIRSLNDGHTGVSSSSTPFQSVLDYPRYGDLWIERINIMTDLTLDKVQMYVTSGQPFGSTLYSTDGKVAFLLLNNFSFMYDCYDEEHHVKEEIYTKDSFFKLTKSLEEIKTHGGVEKVIIDISTNGGGTVGVLMKILALLSSDNSSHVDFKDEGVNGIYSAVSKVDSNLDGVYNLDDVYGDDFSFYLLTSSYSFSCGNALPFTAQLDGKATIIGQTSGGGECAVGMSLLPTGELINHSSYTHIGCYKNNSFIGDEIGTTPDIIIPYYNFFKSVDNLESLIG